MRSAAIATILALIVIAALFRAIQPDTSRSGDPPRNPAQSVDTDLFQDSPPQKIDPAPFRKQQSFDFRVLDRVTGTPVAGAVAYHDVDGARTCSKRPTDDQGRGSMVLSGDMLPPTMYT